MTEDPVAIINAQLQSIDDQINLLLQDGNDTDVMIEHLAYQVSQEAIEQAMIEVSQEEVTVPTTAAVTDTISYEVSQDEEEVTVPITAAVTDTISQEVSQEVSQDAIMDEEEWLIQ